MKWALSGRARLKSPGSIWVAPIPVLTNRKYLPIVDKKCGLDRLGPSNRAQPVFDYLYQKPLFFRANSTYAKELAIYYSIIGNFRMK